ncbi:MULTISPECIES: ABC transporter substrate-binding protein/permease [Planktothrix]|nr:MULTISPECIES: ABC transporter substrate-binding protein/permease [Planktothrix]
MGQSPQIFAQENPSGTTKTLVMATSPDYPPYEFKDTATSGEKIVGFDVDIAEYITKQLGYNLTVVGMDFNGLIPALTAKRADFVMAGMTPTPDRKKNVEFSDIYFEAKNTIVSLQDKNYKNPDQLKGKKVGVQLGSIQQEAVKNWQGVIAVPLNKTSDIIQELNSKRLDAGVLENTIVKGYIAANPGLVYNEVPNTEEAGSAIAFPKGSPLVQPFNEVIQQMKASGKIEQLAKKWFDRPVVTQAPEVPHGKGLKLDFNKIAPNIPYILAGIFITLQFSLVSAFFGFIWGTILALFKISTIKPLNIFSQGYTSIFRGTPLLVQLTLIYFATPQLTGYDITAFQAGILTFSLNSGAYISETIRAGIQAVDKGQKEACEALGVNYQLMMLDIILPQALKNILPALVNESINLLKDSTLVSVIGVEDLLRRAQIVGAEKYIYFEPLIFVAVIYYLMIITLTWGANKLEYQLKRSS